MDIEKNGKADFPDATRVISRFGDTEVILMKDRIISRVGNNELIQTKDQILARFTKKEDDNGQRGSEDRLAESMRDIGLEEEDIGTILAIYRRHKQKNQ